MVGWERLVVRERSKIRPSLLGRCAQHLEYPPQLVVHVRARKQRSSSLRQLCASETAYIHETFQSAILGPTSYYGYTYRQIYILRSTYQWTSCIVWLQIERLVDGTIALRLRRSNISQVSQRLLPVQSRPTSTPRSGSKFQTALKS